MSDEIDIANDRVEADMARALHAARAAALKPEAEYTGLCLNCGELTRPLQRFCDVSCRNDWQARKDRS